MNRRRQPDRLEFDRRIKPTWSVDDAVKVLLVLAIAVAVAGLVALVRWIGG